MRLNEGFVVGGHYRVDALVANGSKFRVYSAHSGDDGPGRVAVKVARHEEVSSLAGLEAGRARVEAEWMALRRLHERATSAAPLPIELVRMYPGDPDVRKVALLDKSAVRAEPYLVCEFADGVPLGTALQHEDLDEERALLLALRIVLLIRSGLAVGLMLDDFSTSNFIVDHAGENVTVVDLTGAVDIAAAPGGPPADPGLVRAPTGFGRLLVSVLGGKGAPEWATDDASRQRWERLLTRRRVPREFHDLALGALGYRDAFDATVDRLEDRIRALVRAPRPRVYDHGGSAHDAPYLIADGERIADRFEVIGPLGQGGRGFVYRARDLRSEVEVLVKSNKYVYDSGSAFALELPTRRLELEHEFRILKEFASNTGMLPQPVALVRGRGRGAWFDLAPDLARGEPFLVMEYVKGIPLLDLIAEPYDAYEGANKPGNRLQPSFVLRLIAQVAELLTTFHKRGFLYQDLKPENILYDPNAENVYLVDFAGACPRAPDGTLDKSSVAFGAQTHGFAAPEFAELWERCDHRFDIYSLGATAYHLLTGVNPERVALQHGTEYPELSLAVLQTLPPPAATLVARCLAPLDQRLPTAEAVRNLAEAARLQLSRSRPLNVRDLAVAYTATGVELNWRLPQDPRISEIRITRASADSSTVIYEGKPDTTFHDEITSAADRTYVVETGLSRRGSELHSRGLEVRAEAWPSPVDFRVRPYFGGNRLRVDLAPHATDVEIRFSEDGPPTSVEEGTPVDLPPGVETLHAGFDGRTLHYAAFARYEDAMSVPRYASSIALGPLPDLGDVSVRQGADGVVIAWEYGAEGVVVLVADESGGREIEAAGSDPGVVDSDAAPDTRLQYRVCVRQRDVVSDPIAVFDVHRWPVSPQIDVVPGAGRVLITATDVHERISGFDVHVLVPGADPSPVSAAADDLPVSVDVPPDTRADILVRCRVDADGDGPAVSGRVVLPPADADVRVEVLDPLLPVELRISLPPEAVRWSDPIVCEVRRNENSVFEWSGSTADLEHDASGAYLRLQDAALAPAERGRWDVTATTLAGDILAHADVETRVIEELEPPECKPVLAGLEVLPDDDVERVDVLVTRADEELHADAVELPHAVPLRPAEAVEVRWRRTVAGDPMPWSAPALLTTLQRPPKPSALRVERVGTTPVVHWQPVGGAEVSYRVEDAESGRHIYRGPGTSAPDTAASPARRFRVFSVRHNLDSEPAELVSPGGPDSPAPSGALVRVERRRSRAPGPSNDRLLQCVRVARRLAVAEVIGPPRRRMIAVVSSVASDDVDALVAALRDPEWRDVPGLESVVVATDRRVLVPWRGPDRPVRVLEADLGARRPDWRVVAAAVEPTRGGVVGACVSGRESLWLAARRAHPVGPEDRIVGFVPDGTVARIPLADASGDSLDEIPRAGTTVRLDASLAGVEGLGLQLDHRPAILVPLTDPDDAPTSMNRVWDSAAHGFPLWIGLELERAWRAPIASARVARPSVFHYLRAGRHVEVRIGCEVVSARGRARLGVEVGCDAGRYDREFSLHLGRPASHPNVARRLRRWLDGLLASTDLDLVA